MKRIPSRKPLAWKVVFAVLTLLATSTPSWAVLGVRRRTARRTAVVVGSSEAAEASHQQAAAQQQQMSNFKKAFSVCLEAKTHMVKY